MVQPESPALTRAALLGLAIAGAVILFFVLRGGGEDRSSFTFGPAGAHADVGSSVVISLASTGVRTSAATTRRAVEIADADASLVRLVRKGRGQRWGTAGAWRGIDGKPLGAILEYRLARPIAVDSDLPYVAIPPDGPGRGQCVTPYAAGWAHLQAKHVTALSVLVDLRRGVVAEISADARRGIVSPVAGAPYPTCNEEQPGLNG